MSSAESPGKGGGRPLDYVLVRHMARSPRTRTLRAARSGHRRQGVLLDDGTRIRKKGRKRFTEVALDTLADNNQRLLEYVQIGAIEVCDPKTERPISFDDLLKMIPGKAPASPPVEEPKSKPEPPKPPEPKEEGYTQDELLAMGLEELKDVAVNVFGVSEGDTKKLRAKQAVIDLILEVAAPKSAE